MLVWFIVGSLVAVSLVFDSPALDHRFVAGGAVLPVAEGLVGGPWLLHTLVAGVVVLAGGSVVPEVARLPGTLLLEALGLLVGAWAWRRFGMSDPLNRRRFWSEGRLVGIAGQAGHENDRRGS